MGNYMNYLEGQFIWLIHGNEWYPVANSLQWKHIYFFILWLRYSSCLFNYYHFELFALITEYWYWLSVWSFRRSKIFFLDSHLNIRKPNQQVWSDNNWKDYYCILTIVLHHSNICYIILVSIELSDEIVWRDNLQLILWIMHLICTVCIHFWI